MSYPADFDNNIIETNIKLLSQIKVVGMFVIEQLYKDSLVYLSNVYEQLKVNTARFINTSIFGTDVVNYNAVAINALMYYSIFSNKTRDYFMYFYKKYPFFKYVIDSKVYTIKYFVAKSINQKIEPFNTNWVNTSILSTRDRSRFSGEEHKLLEIYDFMNKLSIETIIEVFCSVSESAIGLMQTNKRYGETMVTMKLEDVYYSRIFTEKKPEYSVFTCPAEPSKVKFLSIEYTHPYMKKGIVIEVDPGYYYDKNEILSALFVKRYLEHQPILYHFDKDYTINVMDSNINSFTISSNEYIVLGKNDYKIVLAA
jgi:hypothetical protein